MRRSRRLTMAKILQATQRLVQPIASRYKFPAVASRATQACVRTSNQSRPIAMIWKQLLAVSSHSTGTPEDQFHARLEKSSYPGAGEKDDYGTSIMQL